MKKLFAIALVMDFMLSGITARAETVSPDTQPQSSEPQSSLTDFVETKEAEDGKITLELLQRITSWKELTNTAFSISDSNCNDTTNKEDFYCIMLITSINKRSTAPVYHDEEYISQSIGGIRLKEIDYNRLMQKYQKIIDIYNTSNNLQLVWKTKLLNEEIIQVDIKSTNISDREQPVTQVGQKAILKNGAIYWESAQNDGSGKHEVATDTNHYIPEDYVVTVNGYAYYSDKSRTTISESYYTPYGELGGKECDIKGSEFRMVHICTETTDLGWVYAEDVVGCK